MLDMQLINIYLMRHAETNLNKLKIVQVSYENIFDEKILLSLCNYLTDINNLFIVKLVKAHR